MRLSNLAWLSCIFISLAGAAFAQNDNGLKDISKRLKESHDLSIEMKLPADNPEAGKEAKEFVRRFHSPEHQSLIQKEAARVKETVFGDIIREYRPKGVAAGSPSSSSHPGRLADDERVYLFFSSSVPSETLRAYMATLDKAQEPNAVMVMRGFVGGMKTVKPTMDYLSRLIRKKPGCDPAKSACETWQVNIQIDPLLFARFGIEEVPAVVFVTGEQRAEGNETTASGPAWTIKGDATLDYALDRINREAKRESLAGLIRAMQETR